MEQIIRRAFLDFQANGKGPNNEILLYCGMFEFAQQHTLATPEAKVFINNPQRRSHLLEIKPYPELEKIDIWIVKDDTFIWTDFIIGKAIPICKVPDEKSWLCIKPNIIDKEIVFKLLNMPSTNFAKLLKPHLEKARKVRKLIFAKK